MESLKSPVFIGILGLCWVYEGCMYGNFAYMEFGMFLHVRYVRSMLGQKLPYMELTP